jgi:hypothetical protein
LRAACGRDPLLGLGRGHSENRAGRGIENHPAGLTGGSRRRINLGGVRCRRASIRSKNASNTALALNWPLGSFAASVRVGRSQIAGVSVDVRRRVLLARACLTCVCSR